MIPVARIALRRWWDRATATVWRTYHLALRWPATTAAIVFVVAVVIPVVIIRIVTR